MQHTVQQPHLYLAQLNSDLLSLLTVIACTGFTHLVVNSFSLILVLSMPSDGVGIS